jgi:trimeric intracellular cation channel
VVFRYAIYYSPFDIVYKLCKFAPFRLVLHAADQLHVAHKVHHGVNYALKHYPEAYVVAGVIGVVKGGFN